MNRIECTMRSVQAVGKGNRRSFASRVPRSSQDDRAWRIGIRTQANRRPLIGAARTVFDASLSHPSFAEAHFGRDDKSGSGIAFPLKPTEGLEWGTG